jgi:hypothetical protein
MPSWNAPSQDASQQASSWQETQIAPTPYEPPQGYQATQPYQGSSFDAPTTPPSSPPAYAPPAYGATQPYGGPAGSPPYDPAAYNPTAYGSNAYPPPSYPPPGGPGTDGGAGSKKVLFGLLAAIAALVVIVAVVLVYFFVIADDGSGSTASSSTSSAPSSSSTSRTSSPKRPTSSQPATPPAGSEVTDGDLTFSLSKTDTGDTITSANDELEVTATGEFYVVYVNVTNNGAAPASFISQAQTLKAAGQTYTSNDTANFYLSGNVVEQIDPGQTTEVSVVFDVPPQTTPAAIELHAQPGSPGVDLPLS